MRSRPRADAIFGLALTVTYATWVLFVAAHHETWRDEADVWLATRDMPPRALFTWLGAVGSPGLWYAIVMSLSRTGMPYLSMTIVHALLAVAVAAWIAFRAPFPRTLRCLLVFSYHFVYGYAVVARSYVLTVLFLLILVDFIHRNRPILTGALLLLLANTNAHGFLVAGIIWTAVVAAAIHHRDFTRPTLAGLALAAAGLLLAFVQLLPPPGAQRPGGSPAAYILPQTLTGATLPYLSRTRLWCLSGNPLPPLARVALLWLGTTCGAILLFGTAILTRRRPLVLLAFLSSLTGLFYIFVFKWFGDDRHAGLALIVVLATLWHLRRHPAEEPPAPLDRLARRTTLAALTLSLCISCLAGLDACLNEINNAFSGSREAARFVREHDLETAVIAAFPDAQGTSVLPYLDPRVKFWLVGRQEFGTYMVWDRNWYRNATIPLSEAIVRINRRFPNHDVLLLLGGRLPPGQDPPGFVRVYQTQSLVFGSGDEYYCLFAPASAGGTENGPKSMK